METDTNNGSLEARSMEYLTGRLGPDETKAFEARVEADPELGRQLKELKKTWEQFADTDVPRVPAGMDARFYEMLSRAKQKKDTRVTRGNPFQGFITLIWSPQFAYALLLLAVGWGSGYFTRNEAAEESLRPDMVQAPAEDEVREKLVLTLLEQPSANRRLEGVNEANKIGRIDETIIGALLQTLNSDPNVNVRLAAIESLSKYTDKPMVREGLVKSIILQESPIVQLTLANLMVALQEKSAVAPFRELIRKKELNKVVKERIVSSIDLIS